jgi:hypothetical protein
MNGKEIQLKEQNAKTLEQRLHEIEGRLSELEREKRQGVRG